MVAKNIKKSVEEIFETRMKTLKKHNHEDTDSYSDSKNEYYCMEDVSVDLKDINASETVALSDLRRPPQKCQKINHLTPMTIVLIKTQLEKSRFKKNKILLDGGCFQIYSPWKIVYAKWHYHKLDYKKRKLSNIQKVQNHIHFKRISWK